MSMLATVQIYFPPEWDIPFRLYLAEYKLTHSHCALNAVDVIEALVQGAINCEGGPPVEVECLEFNDDATPREGT